MIRIALPYTKLAKETITPIGYTSSFREPEAFMDSLLAYLHDAAFLEWVHSGGWPRTSTLRIRCHDDAGYAPWNGRVLRLQFGNVFVAQTTLLGYSTGTDTIDSVSDQIPSEVQPLLNNGRNAGLHIPPEHFCISLHSGSMIVIVCERMELAIE